MVDTNVAVVANGLAAGVNADCVLACIRHLSLIRREHCLLVDGSGLIVEEYRRNLSPSGQPGPGDAFFKWLWDNQVTEDVCKQVLITPTHGDDRGFEEFPEDMELSRFDRDDRKFVAVALASEAQPPIVNASDTDWWHFREALTRNGLRLKFLCPELMTGEG